MVCQFAEDLLSGGVAGLSARDMRQYLEFTADQRPAALGLPRYRARQSQRPLEPGGRLQVGSPAR